MKIRSMLSAIVLCLFAASAANAVVVFTATTSVTGGHPLSAVQLGDTITINIRMSNPTAVAIFGVGAGVESWNNSITQFVSGEMNVGPYFCATAGTGCTLGLSNGLALPSDANTGNFLAAPGDVQTVAGVGNYVPIVQAISTTGRAGNGVKDPGLDGVVSGGDAQIRLVFNAAALGDSIITIGTNPNPIIGNVIVLTGGATANATNAVLNIHVPEPGMAGAGLAAIGSAVALAGVRRRFTA